MTQSMIQPKTSLRMINMDRRRFLAAAIAAAGMGAGGSTPLLSNVTGPNKVLLRFDPVPMTSPKFDLFVSLEQMSDGRVCLIAGSSSDNARLWAMSEEPWSQDKIDEFLADFRKRGYFDIYEIG